MARTPNADKLNASLRTSTRKRKAAPTIIISDGEDDADYQEVFKVESEDDYEGWKEDEGEDENATSSGKRKIRKKTTPVASTSAKRVKKASVTDVLVDIEDAPVDSRPHGAAYHNEGRIISQTNDLLQWFEEVRYVSGVSRMNNRVKGVAEMLYILQRETSHAVAESIYG